MRMRENFWKNLDNLITRPGLPRVKLLAENSRRTVLFCSSWLEASLHAWFLEFDWG
jgi:hypothetical protein